MKFLTGRPFPTFEEWKKTLGERGVKWEMLEDYEIKILWLTDRTSFVEGCMQEAIDLLNHKDYPVEFRNYCENNNLDFWHSPVIPVHYSRWVAGLLEASLGENKEVEKE